MRRASLDPSRSCSSRLPPLLLGVINKTKALFAGRVGAAAPCSRTTTSSSSSGRGSVFSTTTTWVFRAGRWSALVTALLAGLLVPFGVRRPRSPSPGDLILFAYLFALARFFTAAAALDTGSAFEGMGAAREVTFACLAEPALFFGLLVLARLSGSLQLGDMLGGAAVGRVAHGRGASLRCWRRGLFIVLSWPRTAASRSTTRTRTWS